MAASGGGTPEVRRWYLLQPCSGVCGCGIKHRAPRAAAVAILTCNSPKNARVHACVGDPAHPVPGLHSLHINSECLQRYVHAAGRSTISQ